MFVCSVPFSVAGASWVGGGGNQQIWTPGFFVDPDPNWICIQELCGPDLYSEYGSGSGSTQVNNGIGKIRGNKFKIGDTNSPFRDSTD